MLKILILCTGNSCRSQMAEGFLKIFLKEKAKIYSAGVSPEKVNTNAIHVMKEIGIDISNHQSNHVDVYSEMLFDYVITVCNHAKEKCPIHFKSKKIIHKSFFDPVNAKGTQGEVLHVYTKVRDTLQEYLINFCRTELNYNVSFNM